MNFHFPTCTKALHAPLLAALLPVCAFAQLPTDMGWETSLNEARITAVVEKKPLLIYFYNREARQCREMEVKTLSDNLLRPTLTKFSLVALNASVQRDLSREYNIFKLPTVVLTDAEGKEVDRAVGFKTAYELGEYAKKALGDSGGTNGEFALDLTVPGPNTRPVTLVAEIPDAEQASVVGDFNDWRPGIHEIKRIQGNRWEILLHLRDGVYEYKFLDSNGNYHDDTTNKARSYNPTGNINSVVVVGDTPKVSPMVEPGSVTFLLYRPDAKEIQVAGTFNDWQRFTMYRNPKDPAMWGVRYNLPPGTYSYKYVIDEEWITDPENYAPLHDPDGVVNSSFTIE